MNPLDRPRVIVVDLGFGDAGKGTLTDALVRRLGARAVVRFNGGAQAGHNVVTPDGRHHTFAQFGAGTFVPGVRTFLADPVVFHPTALLVEAQHLASVGVPDALDRITVSEDCLVTTPFQQAATCIRELARGPNRHGSCGVGVGETMADAIAFPERAVRAKDLRDPRRLRVTLRELQRSKRALLERELLALPRTPLAETQRQILEDPEVVDAWLSAVEPFATSSVIEDDTRLQALLGGDAPVVFEGAQGVLLDEWLGFHPFTTWSTCTFANALSLLDRYGSRRPEDVCRLGVVRAFATRHGAGPFPTESSDLPGGRTVEHNVSGPWQGDFRTGWFDAVLARYAIAAAGGVDGLALTHLDRFTDARAWRFAQGYDSPDDGPDCWRRDPSGLVTDLRLQPPRDLEASAALALRLFDVRPRYEELVSPDSAAIVQAVERAVGAPVRVTSSGPTTMDKRFSSL